MTDNTTETPPHFQGQVTQKAILFNPDAEILLVRSAATNSWSLPGDRIHEAEPTTTAIHRELQEETDVDADIGPPIATLMDAWHTADGDPMYTVVFHAETSHTDITLNHEHDHSTWVNPPEAADRLPFKDLATAVRRAKTIYAQ